MQKIEHIGIAVKDLDKAEKLYEQMLGTPSYKREEVITEHVITSFFRSATGKIELLQATSEESAIHKFIDRKGEGMHHIAFAVPDIIIEMNRMKAEGFTLLSETPKLGADNKLVCFIHPKSAHGVLIELCQEIQE